MAAQVTKPQRTERKARKIDRPSVEAMYAGGMTTRQIAETQDVSHTTISRYLQKLTDDKDVIAQHRQALVNGELRIHAKATSVTDKILDSMNDSYVSSMNETQKNNALNALNNVRGTAFDKYRIESGQSSENINVLVTAIDALKRRKSVDNYHLSTDGRDSVVDNIEVEPNP